jgi:hypothetical protein
MLARSAFIRRSLLPVPVAVSQNELEGFSIKMLIKITNLGSEVAAERHMIRSLAEAEQKIAARCEQLHDVAPHVGG